MYSSVNDLSSLGRHIFKNTLLSRPVTQRWIRPVSPTSDIIAGIGAPWGLRRIQLGNATTTNRIVDAYGKAGSINAYQSLVVLLPDYEVGIVALLAGAWPGNANWHMADVIGEIIIPKLEQAVRERARDVYAGTYTSMDEALNSTVTFTTDPQRPGLGVERWVSNGTDGKHPGDIYISDTPISFTVSWPHWLMANSARRSPTRHLRLHAPRRQRHGPVDPDLPDGIRDDE